MIGYYDYILGLIPVTLLGITGLLSLAGLPEVLAVPAGAAVAIGLMAHAMFVRGPVVERPPSTATGSGAGPINAD